MLPGTAFLQRSAFPERQGGATELRYHAVSLARHGRRLCVSLGWISPLDFDEAARFHWWGMLESWPQSKESMRAPMARVKAQPIMVELTCLALNQEMVAHAYKTHVTPWLLARTSSQTRTSTYATSPQWQRRQVYMAG